MPDNSTDDTLLRRFTLLKKMEYYLEESVYYRTHFGNMPDKETLIKIEEDTGKITIK